MILQIYKSMGNFKSPMDNADEFGIPTENVKYLNQLLNREANVLLHAMK